KVDKGVLLGFLQKVSGYSRIQIKRLVRQSMQTGTLKRRQRTVNGFTRIYTREDVQRLAHMDELHGTLSGPATKKLCERAYTVFGQAAYQRLAGISVGHLYNPAARHPLPCRATSLREDPSLRLPHRRTP
ncbi:integrase, catalytic region, partial [mine drainage metagenome]